MNARWTINEEKQLINDIANSKSYQELAPKYNRSANALELRIKKIVYDNIAAKRTPEMIGGQLNLPVDKVKQYFYSYKEMLEKRGKPVSGIDVNNNIKQETIGAGNNISAKPNNLNMSMSAGNIKNRQVNQNNQQVSQQNNQQIIDQVGGNQDLINIKNQNDTFKEVIENVKMRRKLRKLLKAGKLSPEMKDILKDILDN